MSVTALNRVVVYRARAIGQHVPSRWFIFAARDDLEAAGKATEILDQLEVGYQRIILVKP